MNLKIIGKNIELSESLENHINKCIENDLKGFEAKISYINVLLEDVSGPKGTNDKKCSIHISLKHLGYIVISYICSNLYAAIDLASEKAFRMLVKKIDKHRDKRYQTEEPVETAAVEASA